VSRARLSSPVDGLNFSRQETSLSSRKFLHRRILLPANLPYCRFITANGAYCLKNSRFWLDFAAMHLKQNIDAH
jgi:hypothetical protein